ncbi:hypothetical protein ACX80E_12520 [Arthrobacter sp. TMN-49]
MRSTTLMVRLAAHAVLLAFVGLAIVAFGCTGAQASPNTLAVTAHVSTSQFSAAADTAAVDTVISPVSTACVPGRDDVRLERDAVAPTPAHLQHSPKNANAGLADLAWTNPGAVHLLGRIPASLTHLDLGIVRT